MNEVQIVTLLFVIVVLLIFCLILYAGWINDRTCPNCKATFTRSCIDKRYLGGNLRRVDYRCKECGYEWWDEEEFY